MNIGKMERLNGFEWFWVVVATAFLIAVIFFRPKRNRGGGSEKKVEKILTKLGKDYHVFRDIVIPSQGGMSHIDFVVVSPYCVFVIDVRREEGVVWGEPNSREWNLGKNETIYNPIWRNRGHMNGLEDQFGKLEMQSVVVFVNSKIKGEFGGDVINPEKMEGVLKSRNIKMISPEQLDFTKKVLKSLSRQK
tara:strand:+ start:1264 stop:1836 length:573 start_codon:yes stop_codon:yes gene_type:complete